MRIPRRRGLRARAPRSGSPEGPASADEPPQSEIDADASETLKRVSPLSMTGEARLLALIDAVRYCVHRDIPGAFAECGVWRGGSVLAMLLTLKQLGVDDREVHLFDTFEGMTEPTDEDTSPFHPPAREIWEREAGSPFQILFDGRTNSEGAVREVMLTSGYPIERIHFEVGPVEQTLPAAAPDELALLRLDTDWYGSTRHELQHLYPRLVQGGVLIVDDYGHWNGCKRAVDEYFSTEADPLLFNRIDYSARMAVRS